MDHLIDDSDRLKPCPFCGGSAGPGYIEEGEDAGGRFIACDDCGASTSLRFACGDDPMPLLMEDWNRRHRVHEAPDLRNEVLKLNSLWNTSSDEAAIADQLDLCRRLAKYTPTAGMTLVTAVDANNYCRILAALGMEEEGDPVAEVERLRDDAEVGAKWRTNSSLNTWFPMTAEALTGPTGLEADANRFRWLTEDHADPETRAKCRELLGRMGVMSYASACAGIDSAMAADVKRGMLRVVAAHKLCTCDGAGRGPGRACVVKSGGRLGELWRCAEEAEKQ